MSLGIPIYILLNIFSFISILMISKLQRMFTLTTPHDYFTKEIFLSCDYGSCSSWENLDRNCNYLEKSMLYLLTPYHIIINSTCTKIIVRLNEFSINILGFEIRDDKCILKSTKAVPSAFIFCYTCLVN